ncbi:protein kinase domain-containing protein [Streptomyces qinzhouensis]|uniref:non-specific serine/threonine protein kinase n=1 Tax=Streptomyces qinzhouensis TaxID=2599401 RepID=A0A5B8IKF5_9ACTN|nr:protein kinase [Streptomyces qinzhouensis]QDY77889.1 protein kinase [Streptomyces qinzhouensis]
MAPEPEAGVGGVPESGDHWGPGGLVGGGRYRMTYRLGRGGMAEVYAAEDVRLGREVAVKLLRADLAEDPVSKARFTREAQSVAGLNHHAIVAVYDSGEDAVGGQSVPYIVMEKVEGRTIRDLLINAEAPPAEQALIIVSGVLEALAYSHQHGIVHRDIKPANVIITNSGAVKVMDFGIARALHGASTTMTQTGMVMGTPQYLSPEQALGKAVDHRSDLYATGCLLYELLALRPPFTGETPLSVVYQHVQDVPVPPSEVLDAVPPELDGLVMRSLAKDPDDRFQSSEEMRGLVQYALQMLQQQGGHTGGWNTGPVDTFGSTTRVMGAPGGPTAVHPAVHGETSAGPILPPSNPDDGGFSGYHPKPAGRRRGRMVLFAALAVIAVVMGVAMALRAADAGNESPGDDTKVSDSPSVKTSPSPSAESKPSEKEVEDESPQWSERPKWPKNNKTYEPSKTAKPSNDVKPSNDTSEEPPTQSQDPGTEGPQQPGQPGGSDNGGQQGGNGNGGNGNGNPAGGGPGSGEQGGVQGGEAAAANGGAAQGQGST